MRKEEINKCSKNRKEKQFLSAKEKHPLTFLEFLRSKQGSNRKLITLKKLVDCCRMPADEIIRCMTVLKLTGSLKTGEIVFGVVYLEWTNRPKGYYCAVKKRDSYAISKEKLEKINIILKSMEMRDFPYEGNIVNIISDYLDLSHSEKKAFSKYFYKEYCPYLIKCGNSVIVEKQVKDIDTKKNQSTEEHSNRTNNSEEGNRIVLSKLEFRVIYDICMLKYCNQTAELERDKIDPYYVVIRAEGSYSKIFTYYPKIRKSVFDTLIKTGLVDIDLDGSIIVLAQKPGTTICIQDDETDEISPPIVTIQDDSVQLFMSMIYHRVDFNLSKFIVMCDGYDEARNVTRYQTPAQLNE